MIIADQFIIAKSYRQPYMFITDKWIKKMWFLHTMEYYIAINKNKFKTLVEKWTHLENTM